MKIIDVIGLPVAATNYSAAVNWIFDKARIAGKAYAVEAANTHVAALARHEPEFGRVMAQFDLICPDGMPLVWCVNRQLKKENLSPLTDRVYGPTLMLKTIEASEGQKDLKHFFLGGSQSTLDKLHAKFERENAGASIVGSYSPPFGEWPEDEFERIKSKIEESGANLIWVGLGCPKQERWIANHKDQLPPACYFGIGAAFAFHAGEVDQAPEWIQKSGLEWLYRLTKEPRRLFARYFVYNSLYVYYLVCQILVNRSKDVK